MIKTNKQTRVAVLQGMMAEVVRKFGFEALYTRAFCYSVEKSRVNNKNYKELTTIYQALMAM